LSLCEQFDLLNSAFENNIRFIKDYLEKFIESKIEEK